MKSLFVLSVATVFLTLSCKDTVAPFENEYSIKEGKKLFITDGYYRRVDTGSSNQLKYYIEFGYYSMEECQHNGYALKYDSTIVVVSWWASLSLKANTLYHISDTLRTNVELRPSPTVFLFGYKVGSTVNDSSFSAKYVLLQKK